MFKKILKGFGIFILVMVVLVVLVAAYTGYKQSEYSETAVPYIRNVIPKISTWDPQKAKIFFVPGTFDNVSDEDFEKLFKWFSKLGQLKSIEDPQFLSVNSSATTSEGANTIVTYSIEAHYENGDATITIKLLDLNESFEVYSFNVNSMALIK